MNFNEELTNAYRETYDTPKCYEYLSNCLNILENEEFKLTKENLEKLKIISIRNNIMLNLIISQIYFKIIKDENLFDKISEDINLLISFCNEIIKIIYSFNESILNEEIYISKIQVIKLIKFIYINYKSKLKEEQIKTFTNLLNEIQIKFFSQIYNKIINSNKFLNEENNYDINYIKDFLSDTFSINEQFEIINYLYRNNFFDVRKIKGPDLFIKYSQLLLKYIYFEKIKLIQNLENKLNEEENNSFLLLDAVKKCTNEIQFKSNENIDVNFLTGKKFYINYSNNQTKNLFKIIDSYIEYIHQNNTKLINNREIINISNSFSNILYNLNNNEYYKEININNFTFDIGYKNKINIYAGETHFLNFKTKSNSLIYIEFEIKDNENLDKDISFCLYKYQIKEEKIENEKNKEQNKIEKISFYDFQVLFKLENESKLTKIMLFSQFPSLYKIEFNNNYSWVKGKEILYRILFLNCLEDNIIIPENNIKFESNVYVYYEGVNHTFLMNEINKDITNINKNKENVISVLIVYNIIRIVNLKEDKLNFLEFKDENKNNILTNNFFIKTIQNYIKTLNIEKEEKIILNIFSLNHNLSSNNEKINEIIEALSKESINNTINEKIINSIEKIGIFPNNINKKIPNLTYKIFYFTDVSLLYFLYKSIFEKIYIESTLMLITFDNYTSNISIFNEGGIYNNLKNFPYNNNNYKDIKDKYLNFIYKANDSFDGIFLVITYIELNEQNKTIVFNIINEIKDICQKLNPVVKVYFQENNLFAYDVFKFIHLFFKDKNRKI